MSAQSIRIAMCQLNPTTGAFQANYEKAAAAIRSHDADIYVFPECYVSNYVADDMLLDEAFIQETANWVEMYAKLSSETNKTIIFGAPYGGRDNSRRTLNMLLIARDGGIVWEHSKRNRPNYDVFDDKRYFEEGVGSNNEPYEWIDGDRRFTIATAICEEIWEKAKLPYADLVVSINSSPYAIGKGNRRRVIVKERMQEVDMPIVYVNQVGGSDELVFDGGTCAIDTKGNFYEMTPFAESVDVIEFVRSGEHELTLTSTKLEPTPLNAVKYIAACMGLREYFTKVGIWRSVVLGLSGGADSGLVAMMAADVLGAENVRCITMPSQYTSDDSNTFAFRLAAGVGTGIKVHTMPIADVYSCFRSVIDASLGEELPGLADENLQAQIRGDFLSFYSNRYASMILSTGNKSELAMGYATLYGDMRGSYNPVGDLYKTEVFDLLEMRHKHAAENDAMFSDLFKAAFGRDLQPMTEDAALALRQIAERPPSAELRPDQKDSDSLPDYPVLDSILKAMIDNRESWTNTRIAEETGHSLETVNFVRKKLRQSEYKRVQSCPKPKIHMKSFAKKDWRYPMVNHFVEGALVVLPTENDNLLFAGG